MKFILAIATIFLSQVAFGQVKKDASSNAFLNEVLNGAQIEQIETVQDSRTPTIRYTCPMHPHIKQLNEGSCPICGMTLVPLEDEISESSDNGEGITISLATRRLAGIESELVKESVVFKRIKALGTIDFDEGRMSTVSAYVDGRIEKVFANYVGVKVKKGEHLAKLYSPDLHSVQVEFLQHWRALKFKTKTNGRKQFFQRQGVFPQNSQRRLSELGMSESQIKELKRSGLAKSRLVLDSSVSGTVIDMNVIEGGYVKAGQILYRVADLSAVWLNLDVFPEEASALRFGLKIKARVQAVPGREFDGRVSFVSPVIDSRTRTVRVRVDIVNPEQLLKPGDFAEASILLPVLPKRADLKIYDPELAGKYISPMHPEEISDHPDQCPVCGMDMVPAEDLGYTADKGGIMPVLSVSRDAVLSVGSDHVVFVESENNRFVIREVVMGPSVDEDRIVIYSGLKEGERVASSGVFLIDSQMQLSGKTSLIDISRKKNKLSE